MGSEVIMVTIDDDVYAMGCYGNSSGPVDALQPRKIESLCKKKIKGLNHLSLFSPLSFHSHNILWHLEPVGLAYGSGLHLLAFSESGELYTWGYNTYSQLGNGNTNHALAPSLVGGVLAGKTVIQV